MASGKIAAGKNKAKTRKGAALDLPDLLTRAEAFLSNGNAKEAVRLLRKPALKRRDSAPLQTLFGLAELRLGKPRAALAPLKLAKAADPNNPDCRYLLAQAHHVLRQADAAMQELASLMEIRSDFAPSYRLLGEVLMTQGAPAQAFDCFNLAVQYDPNDGESWFQLGLAHKDRGEESEALKCYCRTLELDPNHVAAHTNRGNIALGHGKDKLAAACYRQALSIDPKFTVALINLCKCLKDLGDAAGALEAGERAVALDSRSPAAHNNLGNACKEFKNWPKALRHFAQAIDLKPDVAAFHYNLADCYHQMHKYGPALQSYERALDLDPDLAVAHNNLGLVHSEMGRGDLALASFRRAVELVPDHDGYKCSYSRALMSNGFEEESYVYADCCFTCGLRTPNRQFGAIPRWRGEDLTGKRLLIWREQGVGDEIAYARYYPAAIEAAGHCLIEAEPRLVALFQRTYPQATVLPADETGDQGRADTDYHVPAGGLRQYLKESLRKIYSQKEIGPLVDVDPSLETKWRDRIAALGSGLKIGICWRSGLSGRLRDPNYSQLSDWRPLLRLPGIQFVNLQYGEVADDLAAAEATNGVTLHRWGDLDLKDDLDDVIALTSQLDLVISAPTAVIQIAISSNVPSWNLLVGAKAPNQPPEVHEHRSRVLWHRHVDEDWASLLARIAAKVEADYLSGDDGQDDQAEDAPAAASLARAS